MSTAARDLGAPEISLSEICLTGPNTLSGRYLRKFWHPVLRGEDLPAGCALPLKILGEMFTIFRGEDGAPQVVAHRCPHRGTQLSVGWVEKDTIRCRYHGWRFDRSGQCVEMPGNSAEFAKSMKIPSYPTVERMGLVYAYFGGDNPPEFPFPDFIGEGIIETRVQDTGCNFFQGYENDWDLYHGAWTHRTGAIHPEPDPVSSFEELEASVVLRNLLSNGLQFTSILIPPTTVRLIVPTHNALAYRGAGPAWRDTYLTHTPVDDENHLVFITQQVRVTGAEVAPYRKQYEEYLQERKQMPVREIGEEIVAGRRFFKDALNHPNLVTLEDYIAQTGQGRIADRSADHLSRTDKGVLMFRQIWLRELQALRDERPITNWRMTERADADKMEALLRDPGTGAKKALERA